MIDAFDSATLCPGPARRREGGESFGPTAPSRTMVSEGAAIGPHQHLRYQRYLNTAIQAMNWTSKDAPSRKRVAKRSICARNHPAAMFISDNAPAKMGTLQITLRCRSI